MMFNVYLYSENHREDDPLESMVRIKHNLDLDSLDYILRRLCSIGCNFDVVDVVDRTVRIFRKGLEVK